MADDALTDEEYATWRTPANALKHVATILEDEERGKTAIITRLRGGMIRAAARGMAVETAGSRTLRDASIGLIRPEAWIWYDTLTHGKNFWQTSDFQFSPPGAPPKTMMYYSVRFEIVGLHALMHGLLGEDRPISLATVGMAAPRKDEDKEQKGPRLPDDLLRRWFELYQRAYQDTPQDTLVNARKSARGMFPGHSIARDRIDELCKGRKTGRKTSRKPE
jgi:hypothetical protein